MGLPELMVVHIADVAQWLHWTWADRCLPWIRKNLMCDCWGSIYRIYANLIRTPYLKLKIRKKKKKVCIECNTHQWQNNRYGILFKFNSWRKRLDTRLPPLGSRVRVLVTPCGFRGGWNGIWVGFSRGFSHFPLPQQFHSTISPHSSHPFRFISSALAMVRQSWSAGTLATHGPIISGLHRISSLDPTLCWTRVEDILFI